MITGWIRLHRKLKDHWLWSSDNRLKWWIDILLTVNYEHKSVLIKGTLIDCDRGQSVKSLQNWASDWNVSKKTVSDFFKLLKKDNMLLTENMKITTRITVCNFDAYNDTVNATETLSKREVNATETPSKRERSTNNKNKELKKIEEYNKKPIFSEEIIFVFDSIKNNFPEKTWNNGQGEKCLSEIDKIIRIDKYTAAEIIELINEKENCFYGKNIQSISGLRTKKEGTTKLDKLKIYIEADKKKTKSITDEYHKNKFAIDPDIENNPNRMSFD